MGFHLYLLMKNTTTHEFFCRYWESPKNNPFDVGIKDNLRVICCVSEDSEEVFADQFQVVPEKVPLNGEVGKHREKEIELNGDITSEHNSANFYKGDLFVKDNSIKLS